MVPSSHLQTWLASDDDAVIHYQKTCIVILLLMSSDLLQLYFLSFFAFVLYSTEQIGFFFFEWWLPFWFSIRMFISKCFL